LNSASAAGREEADPKQKLEARIQRLTAELQAREAKHEEGTTKQRAEITGLRTVVTEARCSVDELAVANPDAAQTAIIKHLRGNIERSESEREQVMQSCDSLHEQLRTLRATHNADRQQFAAQGEKVLRPR
jgi:hypothetical protein